MKNATLAVVSILLLASVLACNGTADSAACTPPPDNQPTNEASSTAYPAPGYAGFFYDDGPTIAMVDPSDEAAVAAAKEAIRAGQGSLIRPEDDINVVEAKYSFAQLNHWLDQVQKHIAEIPGSVASGVDQTHNRLFFGVETDDVEPAIKQYLKESCVPDGAYEFEQIKAPIPF